VVPVGHVIEFEECRVRTAIAHQPKKIVGRAGIAAQQFVLAELPQVAGPADDRRFAPPWIDAVRINAVPPPRGRCRLERGFEPLDLDRLEPEEGDIEPFSGQQLRHLWDLDSEALAIPPRVFGDFVVGNRQNSLFRRRKSGDDDGRNGLETEQLRRVEAAVSGKEIVLLVHQHGISEADGDDVVCNLADLFRRVGPACCADCA
jgi:hypothetical protein